MKRVAVAFALAGVLFAARPAAACTLTIESNDPALASSVEAAFAHRPDIDACARVVLTARGKAISIAVVLPDGRTAVRTVTRREDVAGALEALLRVPAGEPAGAEEPLRAEEPPAEAAVLEPLPAPALPPAEQRDALTPAPRPRSPALAAELGVGTGARLGSRPSVGAGAVFVFDVRSWLVGAQGRLDRYTKGAETEPSRAVSFAAIGGRRVRFDTMTIDLFAGAGMKMEQAQRDVPFPVRFDERRAAPALAGEPARSDTPEIVLGARLNFRARSILRTFLALDGAAGAAWSLGLTVGAAVGS